jgi:peptidoglycan/LPS O-acetylase OafA/YrhL
MVGAVNVPPAGPAPPATLRWAVWLLFIEAALAGVGAGFFGYEAATQKAVSAGSAGSVIGFTAGTAVLFGLLGVLLRQHRAAARGPAIVLELLLLPIGYYMVEGGVPWLGAPVMLLGLAAAALLLAPATRQSLGIR